MMAKSASGISALTKNQQIDPLLTTEQAADYLGVTQSTLNVWRCVGRYEIEYIKIGRLVKYRQSALDSFIQNRTHGGAPLSN